MTADGMFEDGDQVTRPEDVFKPSPLWHGMVIRRYGAHGGFDDRTWYDDELYEVRWDNGVVRKGYFRHGLDPEAVPPHSRSEAKALKNPPTPT